MADYSLAHDQLRSFVERVERIEEEIKALNRNAFDVPTLKKVVRARKMDAGERAEADALFDTYMHALGMAPAPDEYEPSRVHVHEARETVDAETGKITEPQPQPAAQTVPAVEPVVTSEAETEAVEISATNSNSVSTERPSPLTEGEGGHVTDALPANCSTQVTISEVNRARPSICQNPEQCHSSSWRVACFGCRQAAEGTTA